MTLGGLALAVGILVDEATVAIENIHTHLARGDAGRARPCSTRAAKWSCRGCSPCSSVVAVFVPSFFMTGRLALAVRAALARGRLRDDRVVPPLELARAGAVGLAARTASIAQATTTTRGDWVERLRDRLGAFLQRLAPARWLLVVGLRRRHRRRSSSRSVSTLGREIFPAERRRASSSCASARRPGPSSSRPSGWRRDVLDDIQRGGRPGQRRHHARLRRRPALVLPDQHDLPVDRRLARRRAAGRAEAARPAIRLDATSRKRCGGDSRERFPTRSSRSSRATSSAGS